MYQGKSMPQKILHKKNVWWAKKKSKKITFFLDKER